jgi:signal transduction histidine kinase
LIDDLLTLARTARREMNVQEVNLSALAQEVVSNLRSSSPERNVAFSSADGLVVEGDPILLRAVIENLIGNAWKFTSKTPGARIEFGFLKDSHSGFFFVRDNGVGFDMAYKDKLFRAFQRLHDASEFPGTGIGLATVQRIVHRHGGQVWAESRPGQGSTFCFALERGSHAFGRHAVVEP